MFTDCLWTWGNAGMEGAPGPGLAPALARPPCWLSAVLPGTPWLFCKGGNCQPQKVLPGKDLWAGQTVWDGAGGAAARCLGADQGAGPLALKGKPRDPGSSPAAGSFRHSLAPCHGAYRNGIFEVNAQ